MTSIQSPRRKKTKYTETKHSNKREAEAERFSKRSRSDGEPIVEDIQARKRKNFITACKQVSYNSYFDYRTRLQLIYLPSCTNGDLCKHHKNEVTISVIPPAAEESVKIEMKTNMWNEALEVCQICINSTQYLSASVLRDIVEIMLNAHDDLESEYDTTDLIIKCQQILSLNFSTHPPCLTKTLRKCYVNFLTSSMDAKEETFTNRTEFEYKQGVVKYVFNRLEFELSLESNDGPLVDKYSHISQDMKESLQGLHWEKKKFEIFEQLDRKERIQRLMLVLDTIIELLQFDLVIWQSRYKHNLGSHIMGSHRPLMAFILWSDNVLYTGGVTINCRQILRLFTWLIHLQYPEEHIQIMTNWLNIMIQTFYICETNSNSDYPNMGKCCTIFAREFYKIISEMPYETIIRVLERIQPTYMQHLVATLHLKTLLSTNEDDILKIFIAYLKKKQWSTIPASDGDIKLGKQALMVKPKQKSKVLKQIAHLCNRLEKDLKLEEQEDYVYPKFDSHLFSLDSDFDQNYLMHVFYISIHAYLEAYNIQSCQDILEKLNDQVDKGVDVRTEVNELGSYTVTEHFLKKNRSIFELLQQLTILLSEMKRNNELPANIKVFRKLGLLN